TMIGWLGVALSGTDAGSNALFGSLQVITANKLGLSPILMGAANSAGGVMGKMVAAQSLVIGCAVTGQQNQEGALFRAVLKHSIGLLLLVGAIVMMYAYVFPGAIPDGHPFWETGPGGAEGGSGGDGLPYFAPPGLWGGGGGGGPTPHPIF